MNLNYFLFTRHHIVSMILVGNGNRIFLKGSHMRIKMISFLVMIACASKTVPAVTPFVDTPPALLQDCWVLVHDRMLAVQYVNRVLQNARQEWPSAAFTIHSADDPAYHTPLPVRQASYFVRPERYTIRRPLNVKHTWVFLELPHAMTAGATYVVSENNLSWRRLALQTGEPIPNVRESTPDVEGKWHGDRAHQSQAISVNQVGYLPSAKKIGYLSTFAGYTDATKDSSTDVDFSDRATFSILDYRTGDDVWSGPIALHASEPDALSQSRVWKLDFSSFTVPGRYRLFVPGVGVSYPFQVDEAAYNHAFGVLMRGIYHQRCGVALELPWTRHTHPACHLDDARVPALAEYKKPALEFIPQQEGAVLSCPGGHHDAGDFGKYAINGALFSYAVLQAFEVYPERLAYDQSPVPESGNLIPDLLEEVKHELDWLSGMQDPEDGAVHIIVKPDPTMSYEDGVSGQPSERYNKQRSLWWKDIHATAAFAAIMARAARTPGMIQHWPEESRRYLEQAMKAWDFCMAHTYPDGSPVERVGGHYYGQFLEAKDEYNWMAVELWLTTGEDKYHAYYLKHHNPDETWNWGWWPLKDAAGAATRSYVYGKRDGKDADMLARCLDGGKGVLNAARAVRDWQQHWATRPSFAPTAFNFGRWGWYFLSDIASYDLLLAASIVDGEERESFIQAALFNADQEFGNAADNRSMVTGIGARRPVDIVHQNARFDGIVEPVPGIPLGFHPAGFNRGTSDRALMASYLVGDLPVALRYVDAWNIEQEFTVDVQSKTLMTYAMLGRVDKQKAGFPTVRVKANGQTGTLQGEVPFPVTFSVDGEGENGKHIREFFWDIGNEDTFTGDAFSYTFAEPGRYVVVCTATDESGWPGFAEIEVLVREPRDALPNGGSPFEATDNTFGLWHFDGQLLDERGEQQAELTGAAHLCDKNLLWMATPAGQAVRIVGADGGVRIPLPSLFRDENIRRVEIHALLQFEDKVPRGQGHSRMFMLYGHWDAQLGLHKDSWAGEQMRGVPEGLPNRAAFDQRVATMASPRPGWQHAQLGFDREAGMAYLELNNQRLEWPFTPPRSDRDIALYIGGFLGYLDEVRIDIIR